MTTLRGREKAKEDARYYAKHDVKLEIAIERITKKYGLEKWEAEEITANFYKKN